MDKEHPIIFSTDMVKAILEGRKTQTRRVVKPQPTRNHYISHIEESGVCGYWGFAHTTYYGSVVKQIECPYGKVGDRLWVRETWYQDLEYTGTLYYKANYLSDTQAKKDVNKWKPSIHMPRWASRITLEITDIRVERLREISEEDAILEGLRQPRNALESSDFDYKYNFKNLWNSLHKKQYRWEDNPWVWVISFK